MLGFYLWMLFLIFATSLLASLTRTDARRRLPRGARLAHGTLVVVAAGAQVFAAWNLYALHRAALDATADKEVRVADPGM